MIALHRNKSGQTTTALLSNAHRMTEDSERRPYGPEGESARHSGKASHQVWDMIVIWSFVAFSFAAFFLCALILWGKCRGEWAP
jgi:hypothetical protein